MVDQLNNKEPKVRITYGDGTTEIITVDEASERGIKNIDPKNGSEFYTYDGDDGKKRFSTKATDLPASITLDEETGNIKITAPKSVTDLDEFKRTFNEDQLKEYSLAYKLNPDYKVKLQEYDRDTGELKEKEVTIPEWVSSKNDSIKLFMQDLAVAYDTRDKLVDVYGDKASKMTPSQIMMTYQYDKYTYIPKAILNASNFGPNGKNPFKKLGSKIDSDGKISVKDLKDAYSRNELGREELAGMMATLDGALRGGEWGDDYYTDENGNKVYNVASATEAAKMIAFKNFLQSHHPDGNWWQEMGGNIETLGINAMYGMTRVAWNIANDVEGFFTGGAGKKMQTDIKSLDTTLAQYNEEKALESEATQTLAFLGMLGGTIAASWAAGKVVGLGLAGVGKVGSFALGKVLTSAAGITEGTAAYEALSMSTLAGIVANAENLTKGAWFAVKTASVAEKAALATGAYKAFMEGHKAVNWAVSLVMDTIHDALLYDSTTLRDALETTDVDTKTYWLGQLADNTKWWAGMSFAKGSIKFAGKTALGKALNVRATRFINRWASRFGRGKAFAKDYVHGGSVIETLRKKIKNAEANGNHNTARRLKRKLEAEEWNANLRDARKQLGSLDLEWKGITRTKLTDESAEAYRNAVSRVKAFEVGIDRYRRTVDYQRQMMVGAQLDPSTGTMTFINPALGEANILATDHYFKLADLAKKYDLEAAENSMISQDMIDYWMGRHEERIAGGFASGNTDLATEAQQALPILQKNNEILRSRLPDEIVQEIDYGLEHKFYQTYYLEQNEYGSAKGIFNRAKVASLQANPVFAEYGYMPLEKIPEGGRPRGRFVDEEDLVGAKIEHDMKEIHFEVSEGQHYEDPELVRQRRLSETAAMEVNSQLFKAYAGFGSDATNVIKVSGEETEYSRVLLENREYLENAVKQNAAKIGENIQNHITVFKVRRRKPIKYGTVSVDDRITIVASMSPEEVTGFLVERGVLASGETISQKVILDSTENPGSYAKWYKDQNSSVKKYLAQQYDQYGIDPKKAGDEDSFQYFKKASDEGGVEFENGLQRAALVGHKEFARSPIMNEAKHNLDMGREAFYQGVIMADLKSHLRNIKNVDSGQLVEDLDAEFDDIIDGFVVAVLDDKGAIEAINMLSETTEASSQFARYIALRRLQESGLSEVNKAIDDALDHKLTVENKGIAGEDIKTIKKYAKQLFKEKLETEIDDLGQTVKTTNPELLETKDIYKKAKDLDEKIRGSTPNKDYNNNMVMYLDEEGRQVFAEVDPAFASLYNYRYEMDRTEASALAKANGVTARWFRYGTTSVNLKSFGNQLFRDFGNALYIGGAWQTIKHYRNNLVDVFGANIVEQIGRFDPTGYEMKQVQRIADATGQRLDEAAVSRELMRGAAISPTTTERTLYKEFMREAYSDSDSRLTAMKNKFQDFVNEHNLNPEDWLNGKRENYLRNRVYAHSLNDAMEQGYTLEQSRIYAEFAMNNATTNFSRQLYHLQAIADSTPYFRAAINGTKSFWRMWSLDPVGITGRITGGLIIPVMYLTGASLGSEENRKVYENLPEYQKQDSLIFVINGRVISAPMPQEIAPIVAPFRQFVEYLYDSNKNDFWELMMNDALGFFPYDLQGFSTIDMDAMIQDPTILDRMSRGVSRVFSQMAPIPVKTMYMIATGIDPYSGKNLKNPAYSWWNDETNSVETMDWNQNAVAKAIASIPGVRDWATPELVEKVISGVFGTTGSNLLGDITALFTSGGGAMMESMMTNIGESISGPFTVPQYDLTNAIWERAVRELTNEKDYILHSSDMDAINKKLSQEKDPDKRKELYSARQNLVSEYQNKVKAAVQRLENKYQGTFDAKKFAAVIQLLNFDTDPVYQSASQYASDLASSLYFEGRDAAISTMRDLGIDGVHDTSIFGYLTKDKDGNVVMRYNSPIAIMDMENTWGNQNDYHLANIKALINQNDLWDKKNAMKAQINAIYNKDKLSDADYDAIDAIYVNWNADVMKTIAPYVSAMTPEAAINNIKVMDYLSGLIEVPGEFKKDRYGKYVTNSKLGLGSAKDAYIESYINYIYGVNDTGYEGGRNYSDRQKYDKENKRWTK